MKEKKHINLSLIGILFLILGTMQQFLINHSRIISAVIVIISALLYKYYGFEKYNKKYKYIAGITGIVNIIGIITDRWIIFNSLGVLGVIVGLLFLVKGFKMFFSEGNIISKISIIIALSLQTMLSSFVLLTTFNPAYTMGKLKDVLFSAPNVVDAEYSEGVLGNGANVKYNIKYDSILPNGFMDVYYTENSTNKPAPTLIYIHGGGYIWGDKLSGDPNAGDNDLLYTTGYNALNAGYNVVQLNYALTPEYPFPNAIKQINRGLKYLVDNAEELNLNMNQIFIGGGSAGGNLAAVLANIQTNPEYAALLNEDAVVQISNIKGIILEGGLVDNSQYGVTHNTFLDYLFYNLGRVYLKTNDLVYDIDTVKISSATPYLTENFPKTFISDGNTATFYDQAFEFNARLTELGVPTVFNYFPKSVASSLAHGFEVSGSYYSQITKRNIIRFMNNNID